MKESIDTTQQNKKSWSKLFFELDFQEKRADEILGKNQIVLSGDGLHSHEFALKEIIEQAREKFNELANSFPKLEDVKNEVSRLYAELLIKEKELKDTDEFMPEQITKDKAIFSFMLERLG